MAIHFFTEDVDELKIPKQKIVSWVKSCIAQYERKTGSINYIFCSDEYLKEMNIQYLEHDYYTDIITFNYNNKNVLAGDIYISVDRVTDNAALYNIDFFDELLRVIIHGVLHLIGFDDTTEILRKEMREIEDLWITTFQMM